MNKRLVVIYGLLMVFVGGAACGVSQEATTPTAPTAPLLTVAQLQGVWSGPLTLDELRLTIPQHGECLGAVARELFDPAGDATMLVAQKGADITGTLTMERNGLSCQFTGKATLNTFSLNATACNATGLIAQCLPPPPQEGPPRELQLVGATITGSVYRGGVTASVGTTFNVKDVGSIVVNNTFQATRR